MKKNPPAYFYKYRSATTDEDFERLEKMIVNGEVYFGSSFGFNDPFDCRPVFSFESSDEEYVAHGLSYLTQAYGPMVAAQSEAGLRASMGTLEDARHPSKRVELQGKMAELLGKWGVFCAADRPDNILMWSHYAGSLSGVCVEISSSVFRNIEEVRYSATRPVINALPGAEPISSVVTKGLFTKFDHWEYEGEWRALDSQGCHILPTNGIKRIIFGPNCKAKAREKLRGYVADSKKVIGFSEIQADHSGFLLNVVDL